MHTAVYKLLTAVSTDIFSFFPLLYAYMQNTYFVPEHRDTGLLCFQAWTPAWTNRLQFCSNFHKQPGPEKGLRQTDATLVLLQAFLFKITNLKSCIWLKHLNVRCTQFFPFGCLGTRNSSPNTTGLIGCRHQRLFISFIQGYNSNVVLEARLTTRSHFLPAQCLND